MGKNGKEKSKRYKNQRIHKENRGSQAPIVERNCGDHFVYIQNNKGITSRPCLRMTPHY